MIPNGTSTITWSELAGLLTVLGIIGTGILWLLGTTFATRKQIAALHQRADRERREIDVTIGFHDKRVTECENNQKLAAQAATQVSEDISEIKDLLKGRLAENEREIAKHGERLAMIEGESRRR